MDWEHTLNHLITVSDSRIGIVVGFMIVFWAVTQIGASRIARTLAERRAPKRAGVLVRRAEIVARSAQPAERAEVIDLPVERRRPSPRRRTAA